VAIDMLGYQAGCLLGNGAVQDSAEQLLMDIAKLEVEKAEKAPLTLVSRAFNRARRGVSGAFVLIWAIDLSNCRPTVFVGSVALHRDKFAVTGSSERLKVSLPATAVHSRGRFEL
jgi:hypothetical protein